MTRFFNCLGKIIAAFVKAIIWIISTLIKAVLGLASLFLQLLGIVLKIVIIFTHAGTPT